ncbi:MAG: NHL repeat-containing protein [Spirochaetaceae bacterium]|nr:NHL repeat-containing protein [Spirochaetaceae bacterium]
MDISEGADEFRWGVRSFFASFYNRAILSFEKAITFNPSDNLSREWLGRAYYMSGLEDTALSIWNSLIKEGYKSTSLDNKIEIISARRKIFDIRKAERKLIVEKEIKGELGKDNFVFRRPGAVLPLDSGSFIVTSFTTNELVVFNANSRVTNKLKGGFGIINNPFDVIQSSDGSLVVTEYGGNQVTKLNFNGSIEKKFGGKGSGPGEFLGPQYIADNGSGYYYISDWGNKRISKFDYDGNFILSFGKRIERYEGLRGPTGIAVLNDIVYVADIDRKCIDLFDQSGNFIKTIGKNVLHGPEGLELYNNSSLLIADTNRVVIFNIDFEHVSVIFTSEAPSPGRIAFARYNANNDLMISDFNNNSVMFLAEMESIYEGLFVRIDSMHAESFPKARVLVNVEKRNGEPIIGLERGNFRITEEGRSVDDLFLLFEGNKSRKAHVAIVFEESFYMTEKKDILRRAVNELYNSFSQDDRIRIVAAGENPSLVAEERTSKEDVIKTILQTNSYSPNYSVGTGIRLGASQIAGSMDKKAVIFLYSGNPAVLNFDQFRLTDTMQFLRNNNIIFYYIYFEQGKTREELDYLCRETGGESFFIYKTGGIKNLAQKIKESKNGYYLLEYSSKSFDEFGRKYIPIRVETVYNRKSGRDELGYFSETKDPR